jgi:acetylornithine deacetylase/succinyl-diaminopimelate desuccinylase-like protein
MFESVDWEPVVQETVQNLSRLIQIDTTNPPGNELPAILAIRDILVGQGIPEETITIVESAPQRANLVVRLRGDGSRRPLLLTGHVDVVPVERDRWSRDPFGGEIADGCVWGRGALDMKGALIMYLQVFLLAKRMALPLKHDLILAAIADEEAGFTHGSKFLVEKHRSLIEAEYALNEGGAMTIHMGKSRLYPIQVAEKGVCWLKASAQGQPGHGSLPHADNAVVHLAHALEKLHQAGHLPVHITPTFAKMLDSVSSRLSFPMRLLASLLRYPTFVNLLLNMKSLPQQSRSLLTAILSNTVTPTVLRAGTKTNVIPSEASADLDCRLLPGQTPQDVMREIRSIIGDRIMLEPIMTSSGTEFSTDTPLYRLLEKVTQEMDPQGIVFPFLMPGATDACVYQHAGITVYGFTPGILPEDFPLIKLGHGHDERLPILAIESGLKALWKVICEFCT